MQPNGLTATPGTSAFVTSSAVLQLARVSRWRAPDATIALADHAVRLATSEGDVPNALRGEGWLAHGLVAIGHGAAAVDRAVSALVEAGRLGARDAAGRLRVELAAVARSAGASAQARSLLDPLLEVADDGPGLRADVFLEAAMGVDRSEREARDLLESARSAFEELGGEDGELGLARLSALRAEQLRDRGRLPEAVASARDGLTRSLGSHPALGGLEPVSSHLSLRLCYELCAALLADNHGGPVRALVAPALRWAVRPASLVPAALLRLLLAERVHLPAGELDAALASANWVAEAIDSRDMPWLEARCQTLLGEVLDARGELSDAVDATRRAHVARGKHNDQLKQVRAALGRVTGAQARSTGTPGRALPASPNGKHPSRPAGVPDSGPATERIAPVPPLSALPVFSPEEPSAPPRPTNGHKPLDALGLGLGRARAPRGRRDAEPVDSERGGPGPAGTGGTGNVSASRSGGLDSVPESARFGQPTEADSHRPTDAPPPWSRPIESPGPAEFRAPSPLPALEQPDVLWLPAGPVGVGPVGVGSGGRAGRAQLTEAELAGRLTELAGSDLGRPAHLVVFDIAMPDGSRCGPAVGALAEQVADHLDEHLPAGARLFRLGQDIVTIGLSEPDPQAVSRWLRTVSAALFQRWPTLGAELPRATFRVAVRPLDPAWSMAQHVGEVRARLAGTPRAGNSAGDSERQPVDLPDAGPGISAAPGGQALSAGRHGAGQLDSGGLGGIPSAVSARPGSGGRRRRPEEVDEEPGGRRRRPEAADPDTVGRRHRPDRFDDAAPSTLPEAPARGLSAEAGFESVRGLAEQPARAADPDPDPLDLSRPITSWPAQPELDADGWIPDGERREPDPTRSSQPRDPDPVADQLGGAVSEPGERADRGPAAATGWQPEPTGWAYGQEQAGRELADPDPIPTAKRALDDQVAPSRTEPAARLSERVQLAEATAAMTAARPDEPKKSTPPAKRPSSWDKPVSELSFAELIDGALAAYREG